MQPPLESPLHSIANCPVCDDGLLGVRLCHGDPGGAIGKTVEPHGLIICDQCEAIWRQPDRQSPHQYADAENAKCPRCQTDLWQTSHWASLDEVSRLGWIDAIDRELDNDG